MSSVVSRPIFINYSALFVAGGPISFVMVHCPSLAGLYSSVMVCCLPPEGLCSCVMVHCPLAVGLY